MPNFCLGSAACLLNQSIFLTLVRFDAISGRMKAFFLFFAAVFVALTPAQAYIENPNLFPLGEQEALMANTGVALAGSSGAVFYNPAGLATLEKPKFSMSANSYLITKTDFTPFDNIDSTNVNFSTSGSQAIPSSLVSVHKWDTWTVAFSLLVPQQTKNQDIDDFETKSYKVQLTQSIQTQFLLFGLSAGAHLQLIQILERVAF